ncbi:hypothetical protein Tco_1005808 [Tanacetum coccineum]|uniref:Uncharacterized protein n=1 Tax=Tanacetum coccineum TaxID=301880 RepID=A0ABQ5FFZ9_9ASTR
MKPKEPTYQVALDAFALTICYHAFLITADVPVIYMHQFWATINKYTSSTYRFKIDRKRYITDVIVDHLHQPWRTFSSIINKCLYGKVSGLDKLRLKSSNPMGNVLQEESGFCRFNLGRLGLLD